MPGTPLHVRTPAGEVTLTGDAPAVIGRARSADIVINDGRVSRRHLVLHPAPVGWRVEDISANGLWRDGRRVGGLEVAGELRLRLGAADGPEVVLLPARPAIPPTAPTRGPDSAPIDIDGLAAYASPPTGASPANPSTALGAALPGQGPGGPASGAMALDPATAQSAIVHARRRVHPLVPGRMRLGRSRDNEITVGDLLASRHHAELHISLGGVELVDLASANGTFVNGHRVGRAPVMQRDVVAIGHHLFQLEGSSLVEYVDSGDVAFEVQDLSVIAGAKQLMHDITFRLPGRSLLGVVGPSGAGKSTLLNALTGFRPADRGSVRYAGRDLYGEFDELRRRIGYVPQADPLHDQLTVREALLYGSELRFPADTTSAERRARVEEVIQQLGLSAHADTRVSRLSGGQKKRTSVALELLTRPSLLFLDEPTSGLDPANDQSVMETLQGLAKGGGAGSTDESGRTVIVVTHSVLFLDLCDFILVLAPGGHVAYFGPADGALRFFGKQDFREFAAVFRELEATPGAQMAARFRASEFFVPSAVVAPAVRRAPPELPSVRQQPVLAQLATLTRRYWRVVLADRSYLRLIIAYPFILGIVPRVLKAPDGLGALAQTPNADATKVLVVLVLCACFMGMANAVREIVKERAIYRRERTIGLSRTAYLGSKIILLTAITTAQCVVFTLIAVTGRTPPEAVAIGSPLLECLVAVIVAALASMMIGLFVSTLIDNADKAMPILVLVTMGQLVFSGGLTSMTGRIGLEQISYLAPARWGFAALASTDDLNVVGKLGNKALRSDPPDRFWEHRASIWALDITLGIVIGVVALALTTLMLRRIEPKVTRVAAPAPAGGSGGPGGGAPPSAQAQPPTGRLPLQQG
ncbi:ABC-type multidrug transport system, ATPase component [Frankia canadensis]|uniref:ABC-type multidrug transport system, ATPase component n=1 Tax=Frankia canadensis TaxID=1836972 RepID=A0A2I2KVI1_9ACTN|nr:ATP-binding cassette domain-containing protein [Frankia canadensis]SNQ49665.1 ABC-type multidrug transport system, ATPase component [Frankia canadensis]SOU56955.1 ABC-type multidrug transport system, ATPase component [Frankia canadensis]